MQAKGVCASRFTDLEESAQPRRVARAEGAVAPDLGFGRIVVSRIDTSNLLMNLDAR